jgi:hypothetical protein
MTYAAMQRYVGQIRPVMTIGYRIAVELENADNTINYDASSLPVRRISYASPFEVVFDILPWGVAFAASKGVLWLWGEVNKVRVGHAEANLKVAKLRQELTTYKANPSTLSDWVNLENFLNKTDQIEMTGQEEAEGV